jgi:hypothetical protein
VPGICEGVVRSEECLEPELVTVSAKLLLGDVVQDFRSRPPELVTVIRRLFKGDLVRDDSWSCLVPIDASLVPCEFAPRLNHAFHGVFAVAVTVEQGDTSHLLPTFEMPIVPGRRYK